MNDTPHGTRPQVPKCPHHDIVMPGEHQPPLNHLCEWNETYASAVVDDASDAQFVAKECGGMVAIDCHELAGLRLSLAEVEEEVLRLRHQVAELEDRSKRLRIATNLYRHMLDEVEVSL